MFKKIACVLIIAMLTTLMVPCFAEGSSEMVVKTEDGVEYLVLEPVETDNLGAATKLPKPTNLRWNIIEFGESANGYMSWAPVDECEGEYEIILYCNGVKKSSTNWSGLYDDTGSGIVATEFIHDDAFNQTGKYTFSVQAIGDGENYSDSAVAVSGEYNFVCPTQKLSTPTDLRWVEDGILKHKDVPNASGFLYELYDQNKKPVGTTWNLGGYYQANNGYVEEDLSYYIKDIIKWEPDIKGIYVTVKALTPNIEQYQNSEKSAFSKKYGFDDEKVDINTALDSVLGSLNDDEITATEALDSLLTDMEDNSISNLDLAISMQRDENIVDSINSLEEKFCEETGVTVGVSDSSSDPGYLEDRGIDVDKISVIGAGLNSHQGQDVDINFSEADSSLSVDDKFYKNSVAVNIDIAGVKDNKKLDVPIQIKMPAPEGVVPGRLFILHYHADGSIENIRPLITNEGDTTYVTFVLTSFSPFVFCNGTGYDCLVSNENVGDEEFICDLLLGDAYIGKTIKVVIAFYDDEERLVQLKSDDFTYEGYELGISMNYESQEYDSYKLFIFDDYTSLKPLILERE